MNSKEFFKIVVTTLILASLSIPVARAMISSQSQWVVFADTWLFIVYAVVLYIIGSSTIDSIWKDGRK